MTGGTLGHYRILEKIGAGGMGEVYRAHDSKLGRDVAIKVLPDAFARDPERLARFEQEARALAALNHTRIAAIYGLETFDGVGFLVLELVPGVTLAERLKADRLSVEEALTLCRQIAEGLETAHGKGIIHRDLKPSNVKITPDGEIKLLDFGLAKTFAVGTSSADVSQSPTILSANTQPGVLMGTAAYMSPEQARGKPVDHRTDIWSFGCVLYEALTGQQTFARETTSDTIARILEREPDWSALPANTPHNIRVLVRRCLEKDPHRRLQHIGDARIEIDDALTAAPEATGAAAGSRSRPFVWGLAGLLLGILAAAALLWRLNPFEAADPNMRFSVVTNFAGVEGQPSLSPDGRSVVFVSNRDGQYDLWVGLVTGGNPVRITRDSNLESRPRWSPDGSRIAYARMNDSGLQDIWIVPALGGPTRRILSNAADPGWSPDGSLLAYADLASGGLGLCEASGANPRILSQGETAGSSYRQPSFSHDGRQIIFVRRGFGGPYGELAVTSVSTGKVRQLTSDNVNVASPVWSPDDQFIYFSSSRSGSTNIWKISAHDGIPERITAGQIEDADLDVSADGKRIIFSSYRANENLAEVSLGSVAGPPILKWLTRDSARSLMAPAYSPDGKRIAYFSARRGTESESIWVMNTDGSEPIQLVSDQYINIWPRWSAGGQALLFTSRSPGTGGERRTRQVALSGNLPEELPVAPGDDWGADMGPDGRLLFWGTDGQTWLFDPKSSQKQALKNVSGRVLRWSPDGKHFASLVGPRRESDPEAGLWIHDLAGGSRILFQGWVVWYAWGSSEEIFVLRGSPDLRGSIWRVRLDGAEPERASGPIGIRWYSTYSNRRDLRFDVHPDRRRAVIETQSVEADIGMIEIRGPGSGVRGQGGGQ
ncbi:MAG: protein kinase domain-containing protein [Acidobacteriota bacterium]